MNEESRDPVSPPDDGPSDVDRAQGSLLAFAAGDALGWPQEGRARAQDAATAPQLAFTSWRYRGGNRFRRLEESIGAGEYSDDTQLSFAIGRARLTGDQWWDCFTRRELPLFVLYQRGAGGATLRACGHWKRGRPPWRSSASKDAKHYFNAGGNGAAMRMLPHVLWYWRDGSGAGLLGDAALDAIATHGHVRAILGAVAYSRAAYLLLQRVRGLGYGDLLHIMLADSAWREVPASLPEDWLAAFTQHTGGFHDAWRACAAEMHALLQLAANSLEEGVLSDDTAVLRELGCFGKFAGAGTVTAAAAMYLASRYAAEPEAALLRAAYARGADTDTLAAMSGGLLGCIAGQDWLPREWLEVQDASALRSLASRLLTHHASGSGWTALTQSNIEQIRNNLVHGGSESEEVSFDGSLRGKISKADRSESARERGSAKTSVRLSDGQTLFIDLSSHEPPTRDEATASHQAARRPDTAMARVVELRIMTEDVARLVRFYRDGLGLKVTQERANETQLGGLTIARGEPRRDHNSIGPYLVVRVAKWDGGLRAEHAGGALVEQSVGPESWKSVWRDPDGNFVAVQVG